ncbi:hypothetical protein TRFO_14421 [Tritrichomonas foetus]|uniref:Uncharacterized protein n=1 Tax=Tritrichomonas foetus TaxID=1144522 RepID=A0A1J4KUZ6_9EUKA|nr:hypothetical protein TRFO_14421 [Tritrichomonas foetus]|eukprot:OHT15079.1 hypothetical protein TRFO_14421 [Tritrichomonas foetus]
MSPRSKTLSSKSTRSESLTEKQKESEKIWDDDGNLIKKDTDQGPSEVNVNDISTKPIKRIPPKKEYPKLADRNLDKCKKQNDTNSDNNSSSPSSPSSPNKRSNSRKSKSAATIEFEKRQEESAARKKADEAKSMKPKRQQSYMSPGSKKLNKKEIIKKEPRKIPVEEFTFHPDLSLTCKQNQKKKLPIENVEAHEMVKNVNQQSLQIEKEDQNKKVEMDVAKMSSQEHQKIVDYWKMKKEELQQKQRQEQNEDQDENEEQHKEENEEQKQEQDEEGKRKSKSRPPYVIRQITNIMKILRSKEEEEEDDYEEDGDSDED